MICKHFEIKNFSKKTSLFLLYGENIGLIEDTINENLKPIFSKNVYNYDELELLNNRKELHEKVFNKSFFENDKLIIINRTTDKILSLIEEISIENTDEIKIILKSGILDKKSKIRNFFEKGENTLAVPYYEDTNTSLRLLIENFFRKKKINITYKSIEFILGKVNNDRASLKIELEKIAAYCYGKSTIKLNEIQKVMSLNENYKNSELVDTVLSKNMRKSIKILNDSLNTNEDIILTIKIFLSKLKRLQQLKNNLQIKKDIEATLNSFKPIIFWKDKEILKSQLNLYSIEEIFLLIKKINLLELEIKKNPQNSNYLLNNFIYESISLS